MLEWRRVGGQVDVKLTERGLGMLPDALHGASHAFSPASVSSAPCSSLTASESTSSSDHNSLSNSISVSKSSSPSSTSSSSSSSSSSPSASSSVSTLKSIHMHAVCKLTRTKERIIPACELKGYLRKLLPRADRETQIVEYLNLSNQALQRFSPVTERATVKSRRCNDMEVYRLKNTPSSGSSARKISTTITASPLDSSVSKTSASCSISSSSSSSSSDPMQNFIRFCQQDEENEKAKKRGFKSMVCIKSMKELKIVENAFSTLLEEKNMIFDMSGNVSGFCIDVEGLDIPLSISRVMAIDCEGVPDSLHLLQLAINWKSDYLQCTSVTRSHMIEEKREEGAKEKEFLTALIFDCVELQAKEVLSALQPVLSSPQIFLLAHDCHCDAVAIHQKSLSPIKVASFLDTQLLYELHDRCETHIGFNRLLKKFGLNHETKTKMHREMDRNRRCLTLLCLIYPHCFLLFVCVISGDVLYFHLRSAEETSCWETRPLSKDKLKYAADDVLLLLQLYERWSPTQEMIDLALQASRIRSEKAIECCLDTNEEEKKAGEEQVPLYRRLKRRITFDPNRNYQQTSRELMEVLSPESAQQCGDYEVDTRDVSELLLLLPEGIRQHPNYRTELFEDKEKLICLMDVILDLGKRPCAFFKEEREFLVADDDCRVTTENLFQLMSNMKICSDRDQRYEDFIQNEEEMEDSLCFGHDNRVGVSGCLHRIRYNTVYRARS